MSTYAVIDELSNICEVPSRWPLRG